MIKRHMPKAGRSIVSTTLPLEGVPRVRVPTGETYVKRIRYLAEVRNRALLPLLGGIPSLSRWNQTGPRPALPEEFSEWEVLSPIPSSVHPPALPPSWVPQPEGITKILFLNDIVFSPLELTHLLFGTNNGAYAAACAVDFINPFKLYDTFATRDVFGYQLGIPIYPFFSTPPSRRLIRLSSPAIPVKSCWGGAIAFNASHFTSGGANAVRFRAEKEPFWDASECCLVHADIDRPQETFVNPFVRVAYDRQTFDWLPAVKYVERLLTPVQAVVTWAVGMPWGGERRMEMEGELVEGRIAGKGGFCGSPKLLVMNEHPEEGGKRWRGVPVPE
ncbi:cryptococcal mannosyltransferase 1-domain-containing protein [Tricharina praecox]|uniref:cryptococcal mannosyltransferase 1-domain-containing protein n=1 Tax=Tricharina praecox TaxID=43433 RepID=UPI00221F9BF6|nr:cryptococcal mannosyltransferase 1-domain-containing protein [Tricharina praecox]KAI5843267.1 cryptococcal mannosyltransferase 1-domain-containing protein [Tricharina praecox]